MLKIKSYERVNSIAEAYELNQKKSACVLGGMVWLKMGNRNISTAIDLSGLGLDTVQELEDEFVIGCMTTLHDLETNAALNEFTGGAVRELSLIHISYTGGDKDSIPEQAKEAYKKYVNQNKEQEGQVTT